MAALDDIEELALCSCCRRAFDDAERAPKLLACKHHFCLACTRGALGAGRDVRCAHCWKRTALPDGGADALPTHAAVQALARRLAPEPACRLDHPAPLRAPRDARLLLADLARLAARRRDSLLRALDAATALKLRLEAELAAPAPPAPLDPAAADSPAAATAERDRLRALRDEAALRCRLDDLVRDASAPLDFELLRRALAGPEGSAPAAAEPRDPVLFLANYCTARLFARALGPRPRAAPLFYFDLEVAGARFGRVVVAVRADVAPRMARNFAALATRGAGAGYRGCAVFQCWGDESVITGDFELNDGRGGRSALAEAHFAPDDTGLAAVRGAVGMRRSRRRRDNPGLVGSQFRIVLREMRGFTAIFAFVVEGLELVDRLSRTGDGAGKPHSAILIAGCGRLD